MQNRFLRYGLSAILLLCIALGLLLFKFQPSPVDEEINSLPSTQVSNAKTGNTSILEQQLSQEQLNQAVSKVKKASPPKNNWEAEEEILSKRIPISEIPSLFAELKDQAANDKTGFTDYRLYRLVEFCYSQPTTYEQLGDELRKIEKSGLEIIEHNPNIGGLSESNSKKFHACYEMRQSYPDFNPHNHLMAAVGKGHPGALVFLADTYKPSGWYDLSEDDKNRHRREMGVVMEIARSSCHPKVFIAYSSYYESNHTTWLNYSDNKNENPVIERIANLKALELYQNSRQSNYNKLIKALNGYIKESTIKHKVSEQDVELAKRRGQDYYNDYCN